MLFRSGTRGRSYLTTDGETVWQSPLSWFTTKNRWDVSPGFDLGLATQRPVVDSCLYCHVHQNEVIEDSVNRYTLPISKPQLAIGCERCHGPGELHSKERLEEKALDAAHPGVDTSIVNPKHLPDELQMSICAQCHLGGKARVTRKDRKPHEFRPGLPLDLFFNAFIAHPEAQFKNKAVGHFDQMLQASCRTSAGKRLLCTSCHDPHQKLEHAEADRLQLENCKSCHQERGCSAPVEVRREQQDHCVRCHMPTNPDTDIAHTSLTDHRILRDPTKPTSTSATATNDAVLVPYFQSEGIDSQERERDLGIALARFAEKMPKGLPMKMQTQEQAKKRLRATVQRSPDDWEAWVALSSIEAANGDLRSAWGIIEGAIKASPKNEGVLAQAANIAELGGQMELGVGVMTDLIALNPASQDYRLRRMMMFVSMGEFGEAEVESRELLKINPLQPTARLVLGMCLHGAGKKVEGRREVDYALNIATSENQKASIQAWYNRFVAWRAKSE